MAAHDPLPTEETSAGFRPRAVLIVAAIAAGVAFLPMPGLSLEAHRTLVVLIAVAGLWITEALPIAVPALLVPVLGMLLGVADAKTAFAGFGDPIVFLFFGTFLLADAAETHGLTSRLARALLGSRWASRRPGRMLWAIAGLGCVISAWVNNTATCALMLPLALGASSLGSRRFGTALLLMTAWAPSLGGFATPVGTAPNLIGLRLIEQVTGHRPSFAAWCATFAPLAVLFTALSAAWLAYRSRGSAAGAPPSAPSAPRPWSFAERALVPLFALIVLAWIGPGVLKATPWSEAGWAKAWQERLPEAAVPMLGSLLLFFLPSGAPAANGGARPRILDAGVFRRVDWGTVLLFGGGLSLGGMMFESGLARSIGEGLFRALPAQSELGVIFAAALMAVIVSEMTSNTASASLVVPIVLALAQAAGMDPVKPALAATIGCSFGFMLPVSTPPNAIVYGTGRVPMRAMVANGVLLDVVGVVLVALWVWKFA